MTLAHALRTYRKEHRLRQKELAERLGIAREYYALIELGHRFPSATLLQKIVCTLPIAMEFFFTSGSNS